MEKVVRTNRCVIFLIPLKKGVMAYKIVLISLVFFMITAGILLFYAVLMYLTKDNCLMTAVISNFIAV